MSTQKRRAGIFALAVAALVICAFSRTAHASSPDALPSRALKNSSSLYLREAADARIRWQPWSADTFALARTLKRPLLIDIGAVWCHWCHVMDQTTYADPEVAEAINDNFVPVKVDTDERPDIDSYYQAAAQNFNAGGWPLTCFATSDGAPLLIAGYLPPGEEEHRGMLWVLARVKDAYADPKFDRYAHAIAAKVSAAGEGVVEAKPGSFDELRDSIANGIRLAFAEQGQTDGPSFYDFPAIQMLLAYGFYGHPDATEAALARLRAIAVGGVFDQLGGGFHRYSVDGKWRVPHFEKLAYDQAMALKTYAEAYESTHDGNFARVAKAIIGYVNSTMLDPKTHTFYSHQDADAYAGDDGSYYTWSEEEVRQVLKGRALKIALMHFGFDHDSARAPDGRIVLRDAMTPAEIAQKLPVSTNQAAASIVYASKAMLAARNRRRAPQVDTAVLTDRNALMASACIVAAEAFGDDRLKRIALDDLDFLYANARAPDGSFDHVLDRAKAGVLGLAADQVYMMNALLDAYQISGDRKYLDHAASLGALVFERFRDPSTGVLTNRAPVTAGSIVSPSAPQAQVFFDDPTPAIQAAAAEAFQELAALTSDSVDASKAGQLLRPATTRIGAMAGPNNGGLGLALEERSAEEAVIAIAGAGQDSRAIDLWKVALAVYRPGKVVIRLTSGDGSAPLPEAMKAMYEAAAYRHAPLAFVCAGTACAAPTSDVAALAKTIRDFGVSRAANGKMVAR